MRESWGAWGITAFMLAVVVFTASCSGQGVSSLLPDDPSSPSPELPPVDLPEPSPLAEEPAPTPSATTLPSTSEEACELLLTQYPTGIPDSRPRSITAGPDDALWFTDRSAIGRMTTDGETETFPVPDGVEPAEITDGPDGALWFTDRGTIAIGRITTEGAVRTFPTPTRKANPLGGLSEADPVGIESGPDGALWFTLAGADKLGRITPGGAITEFDLPGRDRGYIAPRDMIVGPDGWMWFGRNLRGSLGSIHPTTHELRELPLPEQDDGLVRGHTLVPAHGAVWFDNPHSEGHALGRMTTTGEATVLPLPGPLRWPSVGRGAGDDVWFTARGEGDWIGRMTDAGEVTRFPLPADSTHGTGPKAITGGPDEATWFVQPGLGTIGRIGCPSSP